MLKVETGTTLKVLKLLYEAEFEKKAQILGVRPKQYVEGMPCIVTLDDSKLNELSYDILVSGRHFSGTSSAHAECREARLVFWFCD